MFCSLPAWSLNCNHLTQFITILEVSCITYITSRSVCACSSLKGTGFPLHLLPQCVPSGGLAGKTCSDWHGIPAGTPVGAAMGDFQCSVYSCMSARTDAGETGSPVISLRLRSHFMHCIHYSFYTLFSSNERIHCDCTVPLFCDDNVASIRSHLLIH